MSISYVFNDIDGCIDDFVKPGYPDKQDLLPYAQGLRRLREITKQFSAASFGVATARSVHECDNIIHALDFQGPSICECGNIVYFPGEGGHLLFEDMEMEAEQRASIQLFLEWRAQLDLDTLARERFPHTDIRMLKDRMAMVTFEFKKDVGPGLVSWLDEFFFPEELEQAIARGHVAITLSSGAVDIFPNIGKANAMGHLARALGFDLSKTLTVGDSLHSDLEMLQATGYAACPSNSEQGVKQAVMAKGEQGYVSDKPYAEGNADIMRHALAHWS
ncbi:MAG: Cof-type HAD-IIB family hydrolase [Desulfarculaceae bacterium]|nr:Cof-type HAD-IIB family hydrolase [Desulfarculaceae bacterium]MCF8073237.1 Cof-type HAD-IIB family hydrolase [Desulfarculaceae bacterium]MCF8100833.1 Cof-type HAD-IIB family hydrolase [Desulfarculaceae bacterium]MCF8118207.1 Cof-type HAD-IIB family hydrolase [Desulfarculaceae bacterium]